VLSLGSLGGGVRYAYTSRGSGFSAAPYDALNLSFDVGDDPDAVARNREFLLERVGLPRAVWLKARHGAEVAVVGESFAGASGAPGAPDAPEVDALVTTTPGLGLGALSADCVLVVLADPGAGVIGTVHCGRPGLLAGIVERCVLAMRDQGAGTIRAAVGPSICGSCYEVPRAMADEVIAVVPAAAARSHAGTPALDIGAGVVSQLAGHGVEVVRRVSGCTHEDPALFSYRRDGVTGRLGALVWRTP